MGGKIANRYAFINITYGWQGQQGPNLLQFDVAERLRESQFNKSKRNSRNHLSIHVRETCFLFSFLQHGQHYCLPSCNLVLFNANQCPIETVNMQEQTFSLQTVSRTTATQSSHLLVLRQTSYLQFFQERTRTTRFRREIRHQKHLILKRKEEGKKAQATMIMRKEVYSEVHVTRERLREYHLWQPGKVSHNIS